MVDWSTGVGPVSGQGKEKGKVVTYTLKDSASSVRTKGIFHKSVQRRDNAPGDKINCALPLLGLWKLREPKMAK